MHTNLLSVQGAIRPLHPTIGVPELGGTCTYEEAARPGFGVEENVARLKRIIWVEQVLCDLALSRINATPEWEVKGALTLHLHLDAEHVRWLQGRVAELRHPPHNFHTAPDEALNAFCQEALRCESTIETLVASYRVLRPVLVEALEEHCALTNPLVDQPTRRLMRFISLEEREQIEWGEAALVALCDSPEKEARANAWQAHLEAYLGAAGGVFGQEERLEETLPAPRALAPLTPDFSPRRDERLESDNAHFPPHWVYAERERPLDERTLALVCKRLLEMDVPEMMASIVWRARQEAKAGGKPKTWDYTADMARQMWDEARHSMMGESWLVAHGVDWTQIPLNVGFSQTLNELATARESHAALFAIEQGLMPQNSGKAYEWRVARDSGDALARLFMDYDWADEVLHVHIGRHLVEQFGSRKEAEQVGNEAFARVMAIRAEQARNTGGEGETQSAKPDWWKPFVEQVLGFTPDSFSEAATQKVAPWKNG